MVAHWPKGITKKNVLVKDPSHLIDLMATCLDLGKATYPKDKIPVEGVSLVPLFSGKPISRGKPIFFEHEGNRAVRSGSWKLVAKGVKGKWELYDLTKDRTEMNDLAAKHPEKVKAMAAQYEAWAKERGVVPFGSWRKNKKRK